MDCGVKNLYVSTHSTKCRLKVSHSHHHLPTLFIREDLIPSTVVTYDLYFHQASIKEKAVTVSQPPIPTSLYLLCLWSLLQNILFFNINSSRSQNINKKFFLCYARAENRIRPQSVVIFAIGVAAVLNGYTLFVSLASMATCNFFCHDYYCSKRL